MGHSPPTTYDQPLTLDILESYACWSWENQGVQFSTSVTTMCIFLGENCFLVRSPTLCLCRFVITKEMRKLKSKPLHFIVI